MSVALAARFGGTPWQWRGSGEPDPRDWGTAVSLLEQEREEIDEQETQAARHTRRG